VADAEILVRTSEPPRMKVGERLRELFAHREVLVNLTRKELKVKYKSSVLGILWSTLNPLMYLVVFFVVFNYFLRSGIPDFHIYLLSGLLSWTFFSTALAGATGSVVGNGPLVTKVAFPREILPLAAVGSSLINFFFQFVVLVAVMLAFTYAFLGPNLILLPFALAVLLVFTVAIGFATSAFNVRYRDTGHLVELALLAWFWLTPVIYPATLVLDRGPLAWRIYQLNPLVTITMGFQRALYGPRRLPDGRGVLPDPGISWYTVRLGLVGLASVVLLYLTWRLFYRRSGDFAEEL
jgi:ABC-type polysaccharide/polyol phosphate export permease